MSPSASPSTCVPSSSSRSADVPFTQCDENKPCGACVRHNTPCSLVEGSTTGESVASHDGRSSGGNDNSMNWDSPRTRTPAVSRTPSVRRRSPRKGSGGGSSRNTTGSSMSLSPTDHSLTPPSLLDATTLGLPPDFVGDRAAASSSSTCGPRRPSSMAASSPDPFPYFVKFSTGPVEAVHLSKWITDLELMHHWATATCLSMPRASDAGSIWQFEVPRLGLTYMFLMHQVLATSALHLGRLHPDQRESYALHASQHQNDAIAGMRESLAQLGPDNCHPLFAASSLLLICAYATFPYQRGGPEAEPRAEAEPTVDDILDVFLLVRGMSEILNSSQATIQAGPFKSFFTEVFTPASTTLLDAVSRHLQTYQNTLDSGGGGGGGADVDVDPVSRDVVSREITTFLGWIEHAVGTTAFPELRVALTWPIGLTDEYMRLLRNRDPAALTVLAYYSVVVRSTEATTWFMQGWGINAARAIAGDLDPAWKDVIQWPMAFISDRTIQL
ncbi:Sterol uptake control protein 2 [Colletotrichum spinosum]|uniref:Sterol uptake control protein 2 n=1 Tax=Colletotrichum spinosum TaxID=1347390 RepID=A0A4R8Q9W0_9PEZI|nr:Sterol uptake control protein 2 [Colletotrichum spinosum]